MRPSTSGKTHRLAIRSLRLSERQKSIAQSTVSVLKPAVTAVKAASSVRLRCVDDNAKTGNLSIRIGLGWAKSLHFTTGQCPVMRYHRQLMQAILYDKIKIAKAVNATVISLDDAPGGYKDFDRGAAKKFVLDPHKLVKAAA